MKILNLKVEDNLKERIQERADKESAGNASLLVKTLIIAGLDVMDVMDKMDVNLRSQLLKKLSRKAIAKFISEQ